MKTDLDLRDTQWDCCVIGNGVSALWLAHWLWSTKKSVLWIGSEEPYSPERAMLQHGWLWGMGAEQARGLVHELQGFGENEGTVEPFEAIYYDARSSRRFRRFGEVKHEWGAHEREFLGEIEKLSAAGATETPPVDLWRWHSRLHAFHDTGANKGPSKIELFSEPRFARATGWPVLELKTEGGKLSSVVLAGLKPKDSVEIRATKFYLGDFDEYLPGLVKETKASDELSAALKGRSFRAGFGLRLWHSALPNAPTQTVVIPLVVSPEKDQGAHVVGRVFTREQGTESLWVGLLTDEEVEDNNEILKKIKQAKRAIERAIPSFAESIQREAVTFEPRMRALSLVKSRRQAALGATLFSDNFGPETAANVFGVRA
jgi:hypothetical protein